MTATKHPEMLKKIISWDDFHYFSWIYFYLSAPAPPTTPLSTLTPDPSLSFLPWSMMKWQQRHRSWLRQPACHFQTGLGVWRTGCCSCTPAQCITPSRPSLGRYWRASLPQEGSSLGDRGWRWEWRGGCGENVMEGRKGGDGGDGW